jgi:hypothetical protein
MTVWVLALVAWLVVFPVVVVALAYLLSLWVRRPDSAMAAAPGLADVIPLEPVRRRRERALDARPAPLHRDHTAPVA